MCQLWLMPVSLRWNPLSPPLWPHPPGHSSRMLQGVFSLHSCAVWLATSSPLNSPSDGLCTSTGYDKNPNVPKSSRTLRISPHRSDLTSAPAETCQSSAPLPRSPVLYVYVRFQAICALCGFSFVVIFYLFIFS